MGAFHRKFPKELVSEVVPKALTSFVQKRYKVSTASLIVVYHSSFRYYYVYRRTILPQTGARRLLRQAQKGSQEVDRRSCNAATWEQAVFAECAMPSRSRARLSGTVQSHFGGRF